ncbi:hypothetical protein DFQ01_103198 [Paenibacillus cellulosilyticus]|uniref:Uncharacterized protein n=2 Tax=Paenibacillus cellulosilyticus TaxID=375489 RepID=A0A2V2YXY2_9BACL|nr:hypothetical protein [Paenibacillus cellulosilyticus]PWW06296.1 hypothetical protein DFQ01_103198 [Paenibacillus cellulosilyticus]
MNWTVASRDELDFIANRDPEAPIEYRVAAAAELKRRNRQRRQEEALCFAAL